MRELKTAQEDELPLIGVHEADTAKQGAPLDVLQCACPEAHRYYLFNGEVLPWHRVRDFQMLVLAKVAERIVQASSAASLAAVSIRQRRLSAAPEGHCSSEAVYDKIPDIEPLRVQGALAWAPLHFATRVAIYTSVHNPEAAEIAQQLRDRWQNEMHVVETFDGPACDSGRWLLCLSPTAFDGPVGALLVAELESALRIGTVPLFVYRPEVSEFQAIIEGTPPQLMNLGIFGHLAIEWRGGVLQTTSEQIVARALGARLLDWLHATRAFDAARWNMRTRGGRLLERADSKMRVHSVELIDGKHGADIAPHGNYADALHAPGASERI